MSTRITMPRDICAFWWGAHATNDDCLNCRTCWRCGWAGSRIERCHIIPASLDGPDQPSNLVLLCHRCHLDAPDVLDPAVMWKYIDCHEPEWCEWFAETWRAVDAATTKDAPFGDADVAFLLNRMQWLVFDATAFHGGVSWATRYWVSQTAIRMWLDARTANGGTL